VHLPSGHQRDRDEGGRAQADRRHQPQHHSQAGTMDKNLRTGFSNLYFIYTYIYFFFFFVGIWSWLADKLYFILSYEAGFYNLRTG
jgi:hypothetical protein